MDFVPDWPLCEVEQCSGIQAGGFARCLEHLNSDDLDRFLERLGPGADLDVRRTTIDEPLLRKLLQAFRKGGVPVFGDVRFDNVRFSGDVSFVGVRFDGFAVFNGAVFENGGSFADAVFAQRVSFDNTEFSATADFNGAVFETVSQLHFERAGQLHLVRARFARPVNLQVDAGSCVCDEAVFESGVTLWLGRGEIYAERTVFGGPSTIAGTDSGLRSLRHTDVSNLSLTDIDLSRCAFAGAHRLDQLRIGGQCSFAVLRGRRMIIEEFGWRKKTNLLTPAHLAVLYRSLRKSLEDSKNEAGAGDFYYGEMEMRRHSTETRLAERWILWLYWALSGYGQRASRALVALLVLIATVAALLANWGQPSAEAAQIAVGAVVLRDAGTELTEAGQWTVMVARFLGPVLLALAVLAVRARVKR